jgi:hypothetical protein
MSLPSFYAAPSQGRSSFTLFISLDIPPFCFCSCQHTCPKQAATSFECDGCGHHASYHNLDNPSEDAILAKWSAQDRNTSAQQQQQQPTSSRNKRKRITSQPHDDNQSTITIADEAPEITIGACDAASRSTNTVPAFSSLFSTRNGNQR